jgi:tetratricopeptide (TPR) repeat protein
MSESPQELAQLHALGEQFMAAIEARNAGKLEAAEATLRGIIRIEPRLPEPHMELGRLLLELGQIEDAESHAREAIEQLERGGQWTDELPETVVLSIACSLLGEVLRRRADSDEMVFGEPDLFLKLIEEAQSWFAKAATSDPGDTYSSHQAFFLNPSLTRKDDS